MLGPRGPEYLVLGPDLGDTNGWVCQSSAVVKGWLISLDAGQLETQILVFFCQYQKYPEHGMRFTGEPAYFKHITEAATHLMEASGTTAKDYKWAIFHQPNTKFPQRVAGQLGFSMEQIEPGLLVSLIGNTYAGAAVIGLTATLDIAQPGDRILMVSFGSGAGSDAFDITVTDKAPLRAGLATRTQEYVARRTEIDYATYVRFRGKLQMK